MSKNKRIPAGNIRTENAYRQFQADQKKRIYWTYYFNYLRNIAISRFTWKGLPEEIPPIALERQLFNSQYVQFFQDRETGLYAVMPASEYGIVDIYGHGSNRISAQSGVTVFKDKEDSVILQDSYNDYPTINSAMLYADSLTNIRLTRDINVFAQRTPVVIAGSPDMKMTVKNLFKQYSDAVPFIATTDSLGILEKMKAIKTDAPYVADKLNLLMREEVVNYLVSVGVDASYSDKRERLTSGEIESNSPLVSVTKSSFEEPRKRFSEQVNVMFDLNIEPVYMGKQIVENLEGGVDIGGLDNHDL